MNPSPSPSTEARCISIQTDDKNIEYQNNWKSCCFTLDRKATVYFSQLFVCVGIIFFCCLQMVRLENCEAQQLYSSLLTMVIGILIPSPSIRKR